MRDNDLTELPEELGQLEELTVLDVVGNRLQYLPYSLMQLKLDALWIDGSQVCVCIFRVLFLSQCTMPRVHCTLDHAQTLLIITTYMYTSIPAASAFDSADAGL